jgi:hypothetical protein
VEYLSTLVKVSDFIDSNTETPTISGNAQEHSSQGKSQPWQALRFPTLHLIQRGCQLPIKFVPPLDKGRL